MSQDDSRSNQKHQRPDPADSGSPPGEPAHSEAIGQDHLSAHERQVHRRGFTGTDQDARQTGSDTAPDDPQEGAHTADESDSRFTEWRKENPNGDFEAWQKQQTAPSTNVATPCNPEK